MRAWWNTLAAARERTWSAQDGWTWCIRTISRARSSAGCARWRVDEPYEVEFRLRRADGAYRWHLGLRFAAARTPAGTIVKWFGTNTDITERKLAEEEREMYRLPRRVCSPRRARS